MVIIVENYRLCRDIPIEDGYDIVVAGGGPAGAAAAISAARLGARVLLAEGTGCLGGMGTSGTVCAFDPMANGERMLVGGFMQELVETLYERGFLKPGISPDTWRLDYQKWTPFNPEGLKLVLDEKVMEAGVEVRFFTKVIDADASDGIVNGVVLSNVEGYSFVRAKTFIDATGDAVLSKLCGAQYYEAGRDTDRIMPATLTSVFANVDWSKAHLATENPETVTQIEKEHADGKIAQCDRHFVGISQIGKTIGYLNGGHIFGLNATNIKSLSEGMMTGRRVVRDCAYFLKKYAPDCRDIELVSTGSLMGVRESRRVIGEYELGVDDYTARRQFHDQIGVFNKYIDIHPYDCSKEEYERFLHEFHDQNMKPGECYGLPYGILVPKGWRNLWVAGRCCSSDVQMHGSLRVMPAASMMGQAAGTAAVLSIKTGQSGNELDTKELVLALRKQNAYLPQTELKAEMTRGE